MSHVILRSITDLRSLRAVIKVLKVSHPNLQTLTLPPELVVILKKEAGVVPVSSKILAVENVCIFRNSEPHHCYRLDSQDAIAMAMRNSSVIEHVHA